MIPLYIVPAVLYFLESGGDPSGLDFSGLISALSSAVTAQQILTYMAGIVGVGISLYVAWTFGRKAVRAFMRAIRGGSPTA